MYSSRGLSVSEQVAGLRRRAALRKNRKEQQQQKSQQQWEEAYQTCNYTTQPQKNVKEQLSQLRNRRRRKDTSGLTR